MRSDVGYHSMCISPHIILTLLDGGVKSILLALRAFISTIPLTLSK